MNKKFKRIAASVMAVMTLAVGMTGMSANASSTSNSINSFSIDKATGSWRYLPADYPSKNSTSPVYVYLTTSTFGTSTRVMGCNSKTSMGGNCTQNSSGSNVSSIQVLKRTGTNIRNNVRNNYNYCTLGFRSSSSYGGDNITGNWIAY